MKLIYYVPKIQGTFNSHYFPPIINQHIVNFLGLDSANNFLKLNYRMDRRIFRKFYKETT